MHPPRPGLIIDCKQLRGEREKTRSVAKLDEQIARRSGAVTAYRTEWPDVNKLSNARVRDRRTSSRATARAAAVDPGN
jgi:hypothetical protein